MSSSLCWDYAAVAPSSLPSWLSAAEPSRPNSSWKRHANSAASPTKTIVVSSAWISPRMRAAPLNTLPPWYWRALSPRQRAMTSVRDVPKTDVAIPRVGERGWHASRCSRLRSSCSQAPRCVRHCVYDEGAPPRWHYHARSNILQSSTASRRHSWWHGPLRIHRCFRRLASSPFLQPHNSECLIDSDSIHPLPTNLNWVALPILLPNTRRRPSAYGINDV